MHAISNLPTNLNALLKIVNIELNEIKKKE
jgi:hypothetical protein